MKLLSIRDAIDAKHFPLSEMKLRRLIYSGERKKIGEEVGIDYILAVNIGTDKMPRWKIEEEQIDAWIRRKAKAKKRT